MNNFKKGFLMGLFVMVFLSGGVVATSDNLVWNTGICSSNPDYWDLSLSQNTFDIEPGTKVCASIPYNYFDQYYGLKSDQGRVAGVGSELNCEGNSDWNQEYDYGFGDVCCKIINSNSITFTETVYTCNRDKPDVLGAIIYTSPCYPETCLSLGKECGSWNDGCGGTLSCGLCSSGETCDSGQCIVDGGGGSCSDECSYEGQTGCDSTGQYKTTCVMKSDGCLDWENEIYCSGGCLNGACQTEPNGCTDSDGGKNWYIRGTVSDGGNEYVDQCASYEEFLVEYSCGSNGAQATNYDCAGEGLYCLDGACQGCTDECLEDGLKECMGNEEAYRVCGNFDTADSCLEWSNYFYCQNGETCSNGVCVSDSCIPNNVECGADGCGNIIECSEGETCDSNLCLSIDTLEDYYWTDDASNKINAAKEGDSIILVAETIEKEGTEIIFEIREDDRFLGIGSTDFVMNVSGNINQEGVGRYALQISSTDLEVIEESSRFYELFFYAHVNERFSESETLNFELMKEDMCIYTYKDNNTIEYCADYTELMDEYGAVVAKEQCNVDCNDAYLEERGLMGLSSNSLSEDGCKWDTDAERCDYAYTLDGSSDGECLEECRILTGELGECNITTGMREINQIVTFTDSGCKDHFQSGFLEEYPGASWPCEEIINSVPCARSIELPFFGWIGMIISGLIIVAGYLIVGEN